MTGSGTTTSPAGWYPDPYGRFRLRYFDGTQWTDHVVVREGDVATPSAPAPENADARTPAARRRDVVRFLDDELQSGRLRYGAYRTLRNDAETWGAPAAEPVPPAAPATHLPPAYAAVTTKSPSTPAPVAKTEPTLEPVAGATLQPTPQPKPEPVTEPSWRTDVAAFVARAASTVRSDLAVHGLAYLGVLLFFAGVFGFVAFAFGEVSTALRPVAELVLPLAAFAAAVFLRRRGSPFVATALELLGGALVPIVVVAAFVDGAEVPPDAHGDALAAALAVAMAVVAAAYAFVVRRRPESPLRFLVAPVLWLGVALATAPTVHDFGDGSAIVRPGAWQLAWVAVAIAVTAFVARRARGRVLADATDLVVLPGLATVVVLEIVGLAREGWPGWPVVLCALAVLLTVELEATRLGAVVTTVLESAAMIAAAVGVGREAGAPWGGAVALVGLLALAEWNARRRPTRVLAAVTVVPALGAVLVAAPEPWAAVVATGTAAAWAHWRRIERPAWLAVDPQVMDVGTFALSALFAAALGDALGVATGLLVVSSLLVVTTAAVRTTGAGEDAFWRWALPLASAAALAVVVGAIGAMSTGVLAASSLLLAVAALLSPGSVVIRTWLGSACAVTALGLALDLLDVSPQSGLAVFAALALALVVVSTLTRSAWSAHLGAVGLVIGVVTALGALVDVEWTGAVTLGCATAAWIVGAVAHEAARWPTWQLVPERRRHVRDAPPGVALAWCAATALYVLGAAGEDPLRHTAGAWTLGAVALAGALAARVLRARPRVASSLAWAGTLLGIAGIAVAAAIPDDTVTAVVAAVAAGSVAVVPRGARAAILAWTGWVLTAVAAVTGAYAVGLAHDQAEIALFGWGVLVLVGALAADDVTAGRRARNETIRDPRWVPPATLGLGAVLVAIGFASASTATALGWWSLAVAATVVVVSVQLRQPALSTLTYALLVPALVLLVTNPLTDDLWLLVGLATVEVAIAVVLTLVTRPARDVLARWDAPPVAVANCIAIGVVAAAEASVSPVALYLVMGVWSLAVAAIARPRLRHAAAAWVVVGVVLLDVGAGRAGASWLTGALLATSVLATALATRAHGLIRSTLQATGAVATLGAALAGLWWWEPTPATAVATASVVAGAVALLLVALVRWARLGSDWLAAWMTVALLGLATAIVAGAGMTAPRAGVGIAVGLGCVALACALAARPMEIGYLRDAAAALVAAAAIVALAAVDASLDASAVVAGTVGFVAVVIAAWLAARRPASVWLRSSLVLAVISLAGAIGVGIADLPQRELLVAALALAGAAAMVLGVVLPRTEVLASAPVLFCAAWLVFASDALAGDPEWFTVPIGLTILVVEGFVRDSLRRHGDDAHTPVTVAIDLVGMAFLVGASVIQIVTTSQWYVLPSIGLGAVVAAWGAVTKVVHRVWFGVATVALAVLCTVAIPVVEYVPDLEGAELWITVAAIGLVALVAAAFLEQGRRTAEAGIARLRDLTRGWEP